MVLIDIAVIIFLSYKLINIIIKSYPNSSPEDIYLIILFLMFYILIRIYTFNNKQEDTKAVIKGIIILCLIQASIGLLQKGGIISEYDVLFKSSGTFINPATYGFFLVIGFLLTINKALENNDALIKRNYFLITFYILIAILYSKSRTAWIAGIGGLCFLILLQKNTLFFIRKYNKPLLFIISILAITFFYYIFSINTNSIDGRFLIWKVSIPMIFSNPLTGMGHGSFFVKYGDFQSNYFQYEQPIEEEVLLASMNYYPFNEFLKILIEEGILGTLLFINLLIIIGYVVIIQVKKSNYTNSFTSSFNAFISIGISSLIFGCFSYPSQDTTISLIILMIIAVIAQTQSKQVVSITNTYYKPIRYTLIISSAYLIFISLMKIYAALMWKNAKENILIQEGTSLAIYANIYPMLSNNGTFLYNYGSELSDIGLHQEARKVLDRAALYGNSVELKLKMAKNYTYLKELKAAEENYIQAVYMNPKLFVPYNELFDFYIITQQDQKAKNVADIICNKRIKIISDKIIYIKNKACKYIQ